MGLFATRKGVHEVFTPRRHEVNAKMYVDRPALEKELLRAIHGSQHVLLCGESGNGKSWLYKKVFGSEHRYVSANCANADRVKSISQEISSVAFSGGGAVKTGYTETKKAGLDVVVANSELSHEGAYEIRKKESLLEAFEKLSSDAGGRRTVVVLENLESIFCDAGMMDELANILLLLDDPRYAKLSIKFLIVGTPSGVLDYFAKTKDMESVANRLVELPKVGGLKQDQVTELVEKGFVDGLKVQMDQETIDRLSRRVFYVTMGVAQRVHEYCEQLAYIIEDNGWVYDESQIKRAEWKWLQGGLRQSYGVVESHLNSRDTAVARRNQVIYAIGRLRKHQFDSRDIELVIERDFPDTVPSTNMGIGSILTELCKQGDALLVRSEKTGHFRVKDPRYLMCIRTVLFKSKTNGKVTKRSFAYG